LEQFLFSLLQCWCWCQSGISSFSYPLSSLSFFYILYFRKPSKNLKISISLLSFVDNSFFITQYKSITVLNMILFCNYNIISSLLTRFRLVVKYRKTEVFYFSKLYGVFNSSSLDLTTLRAPYYFSKLYGNT